MRKLLLLAFLIGAIPFASQAQDDVAPFEVFGGYSYLRTGSPYDQDLHGWNTSVAGNLTRHIAVKGDFGGHYDNYRYSSLLGTVHVNNRVHTFLFGPQFNFRVTDRVNPFVHVLVGAANDRTHARVGTVRSIVSDTGFAMAAGGGLDAKLNDHMSIRIFQTDYLLTRYRDPSLLPYERRNIHHFRFSTGVVVH
jgi:opacity protein-like surface antigen